MALRQLRGGLKASLRLATASRVTFTSVLARSEFALTEQLTSKPTPLRPSVAQLSQPHGQLDFAAQAQALVDSPAAEAASSVYRIQVVTGDVRGAGTQAPAVLTLYGESGNSCDYIVGNEQDENPCPGRELI